MAKQTWRPGTMIYPLPAVLVSCGRMDGERNVFTASWTGTICSDPPMCYVSIRKSRHSYNIIKESGEFVINLTNSELAKAADWCGVKSGREVDKFEAMGLTAVKGSVVSAPMIDESPVNIECKVVEIKELGTHDMFIANVVAVNADEKYMNPKTGAFDLGAADMIAYMHGQYYKLGKRIGKFGWTVEKKRK